MVHKNENTIVRNGLRGIITFQETFLIHFLGKNSIRERVYSLFYSVLRSEICASAAVIAVARNCGFEHSVHIISQCVKEPTGFIYLHA